VPAPTRESRPELAAFAAWLKSRMRARRMSGNELARRIDSSGSGVAEWMRAIRQPRVETLRRLSAEFGVPLEELEAMLPAPVAELAGMTGADLARVKGLLAQEGYGGLIDVRVTTDDLVDRTPPIARGMVVWIDPMIAPSPGRVVAVEVRGEVWLRSLSEDGRVLRSAVSGYFPLAAVDRVIGVGRLAQVPL